MQEPASNIAYNVCVQKTDLAVPSGHQMHVG